MKEGYPQQGVIIFGDEPLLLAVLTKILPGWALTVGFRRGRQYRLSAEELIDPYARLRRDGLDAREQVALPGLDAGLAEDLPPDETRRLIPRDHAEVDPRPLGDVYDLVA